MKPRSDDFQVEQQIFLGGQVSHKHQEFKDMAKLSAEYAEVYFILKKIPEWEKEQDYTKVMLEILNILGEIDFLKSTTELTRLSMIMGDTRKHYSMKGVMDELRKSKPNTGT